MSFFSFSRNVFMYDYFKQLRREVGKALLDLSAISRYDYYYHQSLVIHDTYRLFCLFYVVYIRASERERGGGDFITTTVFVPPLSIVLRALFVSAWSLHDGALIQNPLWHLSAGCFHHIAASRYSHTTS